MHYLDIFDVIDLQEDKIIASVAIAIQPGTQSHYSWYLRKETTFTLLSDIGSMSVNEARAFEHGGQLLSIVTKHFEAYDPEKLKFARVHADMWNDASKISPEVTASAWLHAQDYDFSDCED